MSKYGGAGKQGQQPENQALQVRPPEGYARRASRMRVQTRSSAVSNVEQVIGNVRCGASACRLPPKVCTIQEFSPFFPEFGVPFGVIHFGDKRVMVVFRLRLFEEGLNFL